MSLYMRLRDEKLEGRKVGKLEEKVSAIRKFRKDLSNDMSDDIILQLFSINRATLDEIYDLFVEYAIWKFEKHEEKQRKEEEKQVSEEHQKTVEKVLKILK